MVGLIDYSLNYCYLKVSKKCNLAFLRDFSVCILVCTCLVENLWNVICRQVQSKYPDVYFACPFIKDVLGGNMHGHGSDTYPRRHFC